MTRFRAGILHVLAASPFAPRPYHSSVSAFSIQTCAGTKRIYDRSSLPTPYTIRNELRCATVDQTARSRLYSTADSAAEVNTGKSLSSCDLHYMTLALQHAAIGRRGTYPNPAVGCVLAKDVPLPNEEEEDSSEIAGTVIGQGFHPAAGMPHAEVFALFEACGHVEDGVAAAKSVMLSSKTRGITVQDTVKQLLVTYSSEGGPSKLFGGAFATDAVTAYVTLEPCCHYGQTPPCAVSLKEAGVERVVVGYRDPNPKVDGGGVTMLREAGVQVDIVENGSREASKVANQCADMVRCFANRIAPRPENETDYDTIINGAKRRGLRSLKERKVSEGTIADITWPNKATYLDTSDESADLHELANRLKIDPRWMEQLDEMLWNNELVLMRLGNAIKKKPKGEKKVAVADTVEDIADELVLTKLGKAVSKKRGVKLVAERIASDLGAHLAQVKGHTALLYRPGLPPKLDLDELVAAASSNDNGND